MGVKEEKIEFVELAIRGRGIFDTKEKAKKLFEIIWDAPCKEFIPERWFVTEDEPYKKRLIFSPENFDKLSECFAQVWTENKNQLSDWGNVFLERKKSPKLLYMLQWDKRYTFTGSSYGIDKIFLKNKDNLKKWVEFSNKLFIAHDGWFGYIACESEYKEHISVCIDPEKGEYETLGGLFRLEKGLPGIFWGNYFNSFYVEWFGKDKFDNLPCVEKEILPDGSIFFTTAETPFYWNTEECRKMQKEVIEHLGKDAFFDIEEARKEIREKVIEKGIRGMEFYDRIAEITRAWYAKKVPKFPFEIKPSLKDKKAENKEVKSAETDISFENQMKKEAEIYVNVIKEQKNITLDYTEKSLYKIEEIIDSDIEIGHPENYQGTIQVLGSYLGETLIRSFGGRWINDPHFNTPAVEINSIRFFPHAKVRKRFENGKIDSLTSFYEFVKAKVKPKE